MPIKIKKIAAFISLTIFVSSQASFAEPPPRTRDRNLTRDRLASGLSSFGAEEASRRAGNAQNQVNQLNLTDLLAMQANGTLIPPQSDSSQTPLSGFDFAVPQGSVDALTMFVINGASVPPQAGKDTNWMIAQENEKLTIQATNKINNTVISYRVNLLTLDVTVSKTGQATVTYNPSNANYNTNLSAMFSELNKTYAYADSSSRPWIQNTLNTMNKFLISIPIYNWFSQNQQTSPIGLVAEYPNDDRLITLSCGFGCSYQVPLKNEAFTYGQALAAMVMMDKDVSRVLPLLNFYYNEWFNPSDGVTPESGFLTVFDKNKGATPGVGRVEYNRIMGPTAWIGLLSLRYYEATGDTKFLHLATRIGHWIRTLPHSNGAIAMGANNLFQLPNFGTIYSVENNISCAGFLARLSVLASSATDRQLFTTERNNILNWLKTRAYNPATGLMRRSPGDPIPVNALDSNTWLITSLGVEGVKSLLNFNDQQFNDYIGRIESTFAVQANGTFGGNIFTARGFDFSDIQNSASIIGSGGVRPLTAWGEGSNQMIQVYDMARKYFESKGNTTLAALYQQKVNYFIGLNFNYNIRNNNQSSYTYADRELVQIWYDDGNNKTSKGPSIDTTAWVYFAVNGINPFEAF